MSDSALEQKAVEIITNLEKLAEPAMQLTLQAVRVAAIIDLATCVGFLIVASLGWRYAIKNLYPKWQESRSEFVEGVGGGVFLLCGGLTLIGVVGVVVVVFSSSTWLAIFAPELQLARLLVEKVSG